MAGRYDTCCRSIHLRSVCICRDINECSRKKQADNETNIIYPVWLFCCSVLQYASFRTEARNGCSECRTDTCCCRYRLYDDNKKAYNKAPDTAAFYLRLFCPSCIYNGDKCAYKAA